VKPFAKKIWHGAAYYPELWKDRIDEDIRLMKEAGIDMVRVAEFAWSSLEPREGEYDFSWLRETFDKCHAAGIGVVLCTPTPTPPRWLTRKYPEVLRVDIDGLPFEHGSRQHVSHTSPKYRELSRGITEKIAREFGSHPALAAWQTDNEFLCHVDADYSPSARDAWHAWLRNKYKTVDHLNRCWNTFIWSEDYPTFEDVPMAGKTPFHCGVGQAGGQHHVSLAKDWHHFVSDTVVAFQKEQVDILRRHSSAPISHNHIAQGRVHSDDLFADLDFAATDIYCEAKNLWWTFRTMDWMRACKKNTDGTPVPYMILETAPFQNGATTTGHLSHPRGFLRSEAAVFLGMGGNAFNYWLWRQQASGVEMCHGSVITAWGTPSVGWQDVRDVTDFIDRAGELLRDVPPAPAEIAVHESKNSVAHLVRGEKLSPDVDFWRSPNEQFYRPLVEMGLWRDVCFEAADVSSYKVVLTPLAPVLTDELIDRMVAFVRAGGVWVVGPMSGCRTRYGTVPTGAGLGRLDELAGVKTLFPVGIHECEGTLRDKTLKLGWYCFGLEPNASDCQILGKYVDGPAAGTAWAVQRPLGKGRIVLLAAHAPNRFADVLESVLAGVSLQRHTASWGTMVIPREGNGKRGYIIANWDGKGGTAELPHAGKDLLTGKSVPAGKVDVPEFGVLAVMCS
jgi:beta-galactosidase